MANRIERQANLEMDEPKGFRSEGFVYGDIPPKLRASDYLNSAVGWVYACVSAICDSFASVQPELYKIDNNGDLEKIDNHKILDVLSSINLFTSRYDHFWLTQQYLELTGEAPWFLARGNNGTGEPEALLLLRPDRLDIMRNKDAAQTDDPIGGYIYRTDLGQRVTLDFNEVLFLKYPDPINTFRGKGTLQAAATTVDVDTFSEEFNRRFFYNSARPDSILTTDQKLTPRQRENIRADVKRLYQGKENAHKTAILESGLDWKPMSISQKDMDFLEQQRFTMTKILSIFRVPKTIVAISDDVNLANAKVAEYVFAKRTILPKLERIYSQLNEFFLPMFANTENMFLAYADPVPQDYDMDIRKYDSALGKGWMTINEVRREQNLEDVGPDGDNLFIPFSMAPLSMASTPPTQPPPPTQQGVKIIVDKDNKYQIVNRSAGGYAQALRRIDKKKNIKQAEKKAEEGMKEVEKKLDKIVMDTVKHMIKNKRAKASQELHNKKEYYARVFLKMTDNFERKFYKTTTQIFVNQKARVLAKLGEKAIDPKDYLFDEDKEANSVSSYYSPLMKKLVKDQGDNAGLLIGLGEGAFDLATARVRAFLKDRTYKFSFEMTQTTNDLLGKQLAAGVAAGESIPELRKRVDTLFDDMSKYRSERIARSEVIRGSNFSANEMYRQSGVVEAQEWLVTDDDRLCEYCAPLDGKTVGLSHNFFDKGDELHGAEGGSMSLDYEDVGYPPLHSNCRCTIIPVIK